MRSSYLSYALKLLKEKQFNILFKQFYKFFAIPASYLFKKSFCGPVHGMFIVNYDCNQRCKMCDLYSRPLKYRNANMNKLTTEEMVKVIDDFADIGTSGIGFTGGEPILRDDIFCLIKHAKKRKLFTHMSSNGMTINLDTAKKLIETGLDAITFSLDGATSKTHDKIRGFEGSFYRVINAIAVCKKAREELKQEFIIISLCVINNINLDEVIDLIDVALNAGADKVSFSPLHDIQILKKEKSNLGNIQIENRNFEKSDKIIDTLIKIKKERGVIDNSISYLKLFKKNFRNEKLPFPCYAGYVSIGVDGYGNIFPCFPWVEINHIIENVRNVSLKKFWHSKDFMKIRNELRNCRNCYWNNQTEMNIAFSYKKSF